MPQLSGRLRSEHGFAVQPIVLGLFILFVLFLALYSYCVGVLRSPGGRPMYITIDDTTLAPGVPTTLEIRMGLTHPLPTVATSFTVRVDENDYFNDDTLAKPITLWYTPGDPYASGTVRVVCKNLKDDSEFDLEGPTGTSSAETEHQVHAEETRWYGFAGGDAVIKCAIPIIDVQDDSGGGVAAPTYCVYKVDNVEGGGAEYIGNQICVRCASAGDGCPTQAVLDLGEGRKWHVTAQGPACNACPQGATRRFEKP